MELQIRPDADSASAAAADFVAEQVRASIVDRGGASLALSGGKAPVRMFEELAKCDLLWEAIHLLQVDERVAPDGHPDRNVTGIRDHLLANVTIPAANFHPMPVGIANLFDAAERYERVLRRVCGTPPVIDVVHLGLGGDGHTASLVPGDPALDVEGAEVTPTGEYRGRVRLTLTVPAIRRARCIVWLVTGAGKVDALAALLGGADVPAAAIGRDDAVIFADEAAAP